VTLGPSPPLRRLAVTVGTLAISSAVARGQWVQEFPVPTSTSITDRITTGPDGNLWYTTGLGLIGRVTPQGTITEFTARIGSDPHGIAAGSDGNLWFAETGSGLIGRITPAGVTTEFAPPTPTSQPIGVTRGPDGNIWFTERVFNRIGRVDSQGITEFPIAVNQFHPIWIASGADGNLWFTTEEAGSPGTIGRMTTTGAVTVFPLAPGVGLGDIAAGPDGNVWFTERAAGRIGRITPTGSITEYPLPSGALPPETLTASPGQDLWVATNNEIIVMSTAGVSVLRISLPTNVNGPFGITAGPDGNAWFTLPFAGNPTVSLRSEIDRVFLPPSVVPPVPATGPVGLGVLIGAVVVLGVLLLHRR